MSPYGYGADARLTREGLQDPAKALQQGERAAARQRQQEAVRQAARAFADLRQFPRPGPITDAKRSGKLAISAPWERETLTFAEKTRGSIAGFGAVDKFWETSTGEYRIAGAKLRNAVRAKVREWLDAGLTDEEIADKLRASPENALDVTAETFSAFIGLGGQVHTIVSPDIRRRFGL